jgi:hypothetical protein
MTCLIKGMVVLQYERYKDFGAEECLLQSGGILCPNTGCGEGIIVEDDARNVQCRTCRVCNK